MVDVDILLVKEVGHMYMANLLIAVVGTYCFCAINDILRSEERRVAKILYIPHPTYEWFLVFVSLDLGD